MNGACIMALESLLGAQTLLIKGPVISLRTEGGGAVNRGSPWRSEVKWRDVNHALKEKLPIVSSSHFSFGNE